MNSLFKKLFGLSLALGLLLGAKLLAIEYREPTLCCRGPLRHFFEEPSEKVSFRWWSVGYYKYADKAFGPKHGRNFQELPALIFNKADFRPCHAFENCLISLKDQEFNPLLRTAKLRQRANYSESGFVLGGSIDFPVYSNVVNTADSASARMGVRVAVPFKRCKINKIDNEGVRMGAQLNEVLIVNPPSNGPAKTDIGTNNSLATLGSESVIMMRADLVEGLIQSADRNSAINYSTNVSGKKCVQLQATVVSFDDAQKLYANGQGFVNMKDLAQGGVSILLSPPGVVPLGKNFANPGDGSNNLLNATIGVDSFVFLPTDISTLNSNAPGNLFYVFQTNAEGIGYANLSDEADGKSVLQRVSDQDSKTQLWYTIFAKGNDDTNPANSTELVVDPNNILRSVRELTGGIDGNAYTWFAKPGRDVFFENFVVDSLGDTDVTLFFEYLAQNYLLLEGNFTITAPTSKKVTYDPNPYSITAGNGGHWEIAPGGKIALKMGEVANIKIDGKYAWVLNAKEERKATFAGSIIKNLGPKVDADVKWQYGVINVDLNLTHPSTPSINGVLGYQFYYKKTDVINYATSTITNGWLGTQYDPTTKAYIDKVRNLDSTLAASNTNVISHRLRLEASYLLSGWLEFFWGGSWSFAGKNSLSGVDLHGGFQVAF